MIAAVESYLAVRRAAGFTLSNTELSSAQFCHLRDRSKSDPHPYGNSHRLGQLGGIGRATTHAISDCLPFCSVP
jgi:hypothetical protein